MAATARILASIYAINGSALSAAGLSGITNSFPSDLTHFYEAPAGTTANGVTMGSVIVLLPTGLNVNGKTYWTDSTVSSLASNGS
jgi:hypothetical protein